MLDSSDGGLDSAHDSTTKKESSFACDSARKSRKLQRLQQYKDRKEHDADNSVLDSGDNVSFNNQQNSQAVHSDQSEDSSLTDSERTLVGDELSPRNNSPDIMGAEMDQDLEPLHAGVEVSKPECDALLGTCEASCPVHGQEETRNMSSPEENTKDSKCSASECSKNVCTCAKGQIVPQPPIKRHFSAFPYNDYETGEKSKLCLFLFFSLSFFPFFLLVIIFKKCFFN